MLGANILATAGAPVGDIITAISTVRTKTRKGR